MTADNANSPSEGALVAPHPGSPSMPRWNTGELIDAPRFTRRNWFAMLGPGLLMGGAAIGGGEWLMGPAVTARYGGGLMWLATLSILGQVVYNIEISRYTLYTGEPIFTGKFRTLPGPRFWLTAYLLLDFGAVFPYLAANAATPLAAVILERIPGEADRPLLRALGYVIFVLSLVPLLVGGKIYNSLKAVMSFKIVTVFGFLLVLAFFHSHASTWVEIFSGFVKFGNVPTAGDRLDNVFLSLWRGGGLPAVDLSTIALLGAFAAIAGQGGLSNTPLSNYTRDQGWGMGHHVGAIPTMIGGRNISLSHVGMVFQVNQETLPRWRRWYKHLMRDQLLIWMPACFIGLALPSMLSVEFLPRGTVADDWTAAGMTADGVRDHIASSSWGPAWGARCWYLTLFCGFLCLGPTMASSIDGIVRRWVDVFWTSSSALRKWDTREIKKLYFTVLLGYSVFGLIMLSLQKPVQLVTVATNIFNFALGFSCWHTLAINMTLLPRELRPGWFVRVALLLAGLFFVALATITALKTLGVLK